MKLLLDTNALIWWITDPSRLTRRADSALRSADNKLIVSLASLWELSIKISTGKMTAVGSSIQYVVDEMRANRLPYYPSRFPTSITCNASTASTTTPSIASSSPRLSKSSSPS